MYFGGKHMKQSLFQNKKTLKKNNKFLSEFANHILQPVIINESDLKRSKRAIIMLLEYIRMAYQKPFSAKNSRQLKKYCQGLLRMEKANQQMIRNLVFDNMLKLCDELHYTKHSKNAVEIYFELKHSINAMVKEKAEEMLNNLTSYNLISNGK